MAGQIVYADLNLPTGFPGSRDPLSAQPFGPQSLRRHQTALWIGWIGNIVLLIAVIVLGIWDFPPGWEPFVRQPLIPMEKYQVRDGVQYQVARSHVSLDQPQFGLTGQTRLLTVSHLVSEKGQTPAALGSNGAGSRDAATPSGTGDPSTAVCSTRLERVQSQLCPPAQPDPEGGARCKLCPMDWRLLGDKCYWVSKESKTWSESCSDCAMRGSQLLVIRDREELESLQDMTQGRAQFWVGLSRPSPEKAWTWLDGSQLDQTRLRMPDLAEGNSCGTVKGNRIHSQSCTSAFQWICQRDALVL